MINLRLAANLQQIHEAADLIKVTLLKFANLHKLEEQIYHIKYKYNEDKEISAKNRKYHFQLYTYTRRFSRFSTSFFLSFLFFFSFSLNCLSLEIFTTKAKSFVCCSLLRFTENRRTILSIPPSASIDSVRKETIVIAVAFILPRSTGGKGRKWCKGGKMAERADGVSTMTHWQ